MKDIGLHELRKEYLDFFKERDHYILESFPLVPKDDKSLLLVNAGMAPLKPYFTGEKKPPASKLATCQRCIRTGDIENVGITSRHATYFEMLGNFSFGDYFKVEAIEWAWEFLHKVLEIPEEDIWVSVYYEDQEAKEIWKNHIGVDEKRIVPLGKEDNFWELEVGPCGPSSEIYIDRGEHIGCGCKDCKPGCECDRFLEVWNLVFTQFDKTESGEYLPLAHPNIDTGMGLERIAAVLQNTDNIFEVKEIKELLNYVTSLTNVKYGESKINDTSIRIITDHVRSMTFLVSDGVLPSNEGRGYVLRRLIRRAARHGKLLGIEGTFLTSIVDKFVDSWSMAYGELEIRREQIKRIVLAEEEKFQETIDLGLEILNKFIDDISKKNLQVLDGDRAFKLYDTYGFPLDLTKEILEEKNLRVDESSFNKNMEAQRKRAREARVGTVDSGWKKDSELSIDVETEFKGYELFSTDSIVRDILKDNSRVESLEKDEKGIILLDQTPFYGEGGGQIGDTGYLVGENFKVKVIDTQKSKEGGFIHIVEVVDGRIKVDSPLKALVDINRRKDIMKNHSATHLLHKALKQVLGEHVNQAGSLVLEDRLRFDFTHFEGMKDEEVREVEKLVNDYIFASLPVHVDYMSLEDSRKMGVVGLFDDKYGDEVRVVSMGDESIELCGGTHVNNTAEIGMFKIVSESSVASGVRRIEAITGKAIYNELNKLRDRVDEISRVLKTRETDILIKLEEVFGEMKNMEREIEVYKSKMTSSLSDEVLELKEDLQGINLIRYSNDTMDANSLKELGDQLKEKLDSYVIVLASGKNNKVSFVSMVSKDLNQKGLNAGKIVKEVAMITGGNGGGRPDMAQAGGKDTGKIKEALDSLEKIIL